MAESAGLPVSHIGHEVAGQYIVTGSPNVFVGSTALGMADQPSSCSPAVGQPVNPILGAKLLPAETDFALPAPAPFAFSRSYLSCDARIGSLGQGWSLPGEGLGLELTPTVTTLIDSQGRRIGFPALAPGAAFYSGSERLWIRRAGAPEGVPAEPWSARWAAVPEALRAHEGSVLVLSGQSLLHFRRGAEGTWRLHAAFDRNGYRTEFAWGEQGVLSSVRDSAGRSYALVYRRLCAATPADNGLRLLGVILANPAGPIPADFDPTRPGNDWRVRYDFDAAGDLVAVRNRLGEVVRTFTWRNHLLVGHGQPGGLEVRYEWDRLDPTGKVLRQIETDGLTRTFAYHAEHTEVTDSLGRVERYEFTGEGGARRWSAQVRADGSRVEYEHDLFGRLVAVTDPLGRVSRRYLDGKGRLYETLSPNRATQRYVLDPETGDTLGLVDPEGREWRFERDGRGTLLSVTDPLGEQTRYRYDDPALPDRPTRIVEGQGGARTLAWNRLGLLERYTDCSGQSTTHEYDAEGQRIASRDALGQVTRYAYDRLGRLTEVRLADGTAIRHGYDGLGRRVAVAGPEGRTLRLGWDRFGRPTRVLDPAGREQRYQYDVAGRLIALVNENGARTRFGYDLCDRLVEETGFDGRTQRYRYNAADELVEREEADGRVTGYAYDPDGRLLARHLPATAEVEAIVEQYRWTRDGRLAGVLGSGSEVLFAYDEAGRLSLETQAHLDGWTYSLAHRHDGRGVRQSTRYGDAPAVNWLTYGPGHLHGVRVEHLELAFERDALHREIHRDARRQGEAETLFGQSRQYDSLGRLGDSHLVPALGEAWARRYGYDVQGQLVGITDNQAQAIHYGYDPSGRLVASRHGDHETRYRFDAAGNRLGRQPRAPRPEADWAERVQANLDNPAFDLLGEGQALTQGPQDQWPGNRVGELDGAQYRYDAAGNLIERRDPDGTRLELAYDGAHRLIRLRRTDPDGDETEALYQYDGLSRRLRKSVLQRGALTHTWYGWDGDRQCAEAGEDWLRTTVHEPGGFVPLLRLEQARTPDTAELTQARRLLASQGQALPEQHRPALQDLRIACFHTDHLGTPLRLSDDQGRLLWRATPDDWAAVRDQQGDTDQPIRFQGQYHDAESGLYYNRYRYYAPDLGRYVSQDPIGLLGGANIYAYPLNPLFFVDQLGLDKTTWGGKGRSVFDGPKNGNWGGKCWSGGQNSCGKSQGTAEPTDSADACYKAHDECFVDCEDKYGNTAEMFCKPLVCNATLKSCLSNLPKNMAEWQKPPSIGTEQDTASFMQQASGWFTTKAQNGTTSRQADGSFKLPTPPEFQQYVNE